MAVQQRFADMNLPFDIMRRAGDAQFDDACLTGAKRGRRNRRNSALFTRLPDIPLGLCV